METGFWRVRFSWKSRTAFCESSASSSRGHPRKQNTFGGLHKVAQLKAVAMAEEQTRKNADQNQRWQEMQEQFRRDSKRSLLKRAWDALFDSPQRS